jgi:Domain of unknown function (DUF4382)
VTQITLRDGVDDAYEGMSESVCAPAATAGRRLIHALTSKRHMRTRPVFLLPLAATLALGTLSACADSTGVGPGTVSILLTDAPGDVKAAVVTISQIYLQGSGRVVLRDTPVTIDLVKLSDSTAMLVDEVTVPSGTYSQLRFVITDAYIEVENADGTTSIYASSPNYAGLPSGAHVAGELQLPSYAQSGLKVNLPGDAVTIAGDQRILLVDFDVARSFGHAAGGSGRWVMTPLIHATDLVVSGTITARLRLGQAVTLPIVSGHQVTLGEFKAALTNAGGTREELTMTDANNDGVYEAVFRFLMPGTYTLDFVAPSTITFATIPAHPLAVQVGSGATVTSEFTLASAAPK